MNEHQTIDIFDLARHEKSLGGEFELVRFSRLLADLPEQKKGATVVWSIRGRSSIANELFVDLDVQAPLVLECQRCLQPLEWQAEVSHSLQVVEPQELSQADDLDVAEIEPIAGSPTFDLAGLLEDELILSLPYVPKHAHCPSHHAALQADATTDADPVQPKPFAVLGKLKKR